jgi:hypothetical protein
MKSYKSLLLILTVFCLSGLLFAKENTASPLPQPPKGTPGALLKAKQAINKNYYAKSLEKPHATSPTDATITCYPNLANYETGSCLSNARTQTSLVYGTNGAGGTIDHGWFVFDISGIPDASIINSVELHAYCAGYNMPYWAITRVTWTDPRTSPVNAVYTDLSYYDEDGYYQLYYSDPVSGWNVINLGSVAATDLRGKLSSDWWACGVDEIDNYYYYWIEFEGWDDTHVPYIVVNYSTPIDYDVGPRSIVSPIGLIPAGLTAVQAKVQNFGGLTVGAFDVRFTIGSYTDVKSVPGLVPCESARLNFAGWNATTGVYSAKCSTEYILDENNSNDKKEVSVIVAYSIEDFEASNASYTTDPPTDNWEWGTPTAGQLGAHSGENCWATRLAGTYDNNADWRLVSNDFKATADNPIVCFYDWWQTEAYYDGYQVAYSTDDGITWNSLLPDGGYNYDSVIGLGNTPGYSGSQPSWQLKTVVIPVANNAIFRLGWRFGSDYSVNNFPGIFIDDVAGVSCMPFTPVNDVGCTRIQAPNGVIDSGTVVVPACSVYNYGKATVSYSLRMKIDNFYNEIGSIIDHTPGTRRLVQFPAWTANQPGFYPVSCSTELFADEHTSNDKRTDSARVFNPLAIKMEDDLNAIKPFSLQIIPNPSNNFVHISYTLPVKTGAKLKLYDIFGNLVHQAESNDGRFKINTEKLSAGIYIVKFEASDSKSIKKITITR